VPAFEHPVARLTVSAARSGRAIDAPTGSSGESAKAILMPEKLIPLSPRDDELPRWTNRQREPELHDGDLDAKLG
jgi:hypothetical protein